MKILTTVFNYPDKPFDYDKMHQVFVASCKRHMPDVEVVTLTLDVPQAKDDRKPGLWTNTCKLRAQAEYIANADDDIAICDCDMLCTGSLEDVWEYPFDIAYTIKPARKKTSSRINGGVLFVRNSSAARSWIMQLWDVNEKMYYDAQFHNKWRARYFGMNQSAMGYMVEEYKGPAFVAALSTEIWNAVDCDWQYITAETRLVHIKGKLRRCIFSQEGYDYMKPIANEWYMYDKRQEFKVVAHMPWDSVQHKANNRHLRGIRDRRNA